MSHDVAEDIKPVMASRDMIAIFMETTGVPCKGRYYHKLSLNGFVALSMGIEGQTSDHAVVPLWR